MDSVKPRLNWENPRPAHTSSVLRQTSYASATTDVLGVGGLFLDEPVPQHTSECNTQRGLAEGQEQALARTVGCLGTVLIMRLSFIGSLQVPVLSPVRLTGIALSSVGSWKPSGVVFTSELLLCW